MKKVLSQLDDESLTIVSRLSVKFGKEDVVKECEEIFEERYLLNCSFRCNRVYDSWLKTRSDTREKIADLRNDFNTEWMKKVRIEFLDSEVPKIFKIVQSYGDQIKEYGEIGELLFGDIFRKMERKYKVLYVEAGSLKNNLTINEGMNEINLQKCRDLPIDMLIGTEVINAGGGRKKCLCPFHSEKTPSFVVFENNSFYCFGCGVHGNNMIDFVIKEKNYGFIDAFEYLKKFI